VTPHSPKLIHPSGNPVAGVWNVAPDNAVLHVDDEEFGVRHFLKPSPLAPALDLNIDHRYLQAPGATPLKLPDPATLSVTP